MRERQRLLMNLGLLLAAAVALLVTEVRGGQQWCTVDFYFYSATNIANLTRTVVG